MFVDESRIVMCLFLTRDVFVVVVWDVCQTVKQSGIPQCMSSYCCPTNLPFR